jgi:tRNA A37 N6-isopentenylltransferase MiaA
VFDEVAAFLGLGLDPELPAMKTVGLRELGLYVRGRASAAEARARALQATRQYAKRQTTWLRHRPRSAVRIEGRPEAAATAEVARFVELTVRG